MSKPIEEAHSVVLYNSVDGSGEYVLLRVEIRSWVTLRAAKTGPWSEDARVHGVNSYAGAGESMLWWLTFGQLIVP